MAKQRRPSARAAGKTAARAMRSATPLKTKAKPKGKTKSKAPAKRARKAAPAPVVRIREAYAKAVGIYERGLKALQRHKYDVAAGAFRQVVEQFPEERELLERAQLYLNVCARESGPRATTPRTLDDRILAATVALNRRDPDEAVSLLRSAAASHPSDDRIHYTLALAHALRADVGAAVQHLAKAIAVNPENRVHARQEPDFDGIRGTQAFLDALKTTS